MYCYTKSWNVLWHFRPGPADHIQRKKEQEERPLESSPPGSRPGGVEEQERGGLELM